MYSVARRISELSIEVWKDDGFLIMEAGKPNVVAFSVDLTVIYS